MPTVIIHVQNEDPVVGEMDALPGSNDLLIIVKNPRRKWGHMFNILLYNCQIWRYVEIYPQDIFRMEW